MEDKKFDTKAKFAVCTVAALAIGAIGLIANASIGEHSFKRELATECARLEVGESGREFTINTKAVNAAMDTYYRIAESSIAGNLSQAPKYVLENGKMKRVAVDRIGNAKNAALEQIRTDCACKGE
jgi:hypothetical protein